MTTQEARALEKATQTLPAGYGPRVGTLDWLGLGSDEQASRLQSRLAAFKRDGPSPDRDGLAPGQHPTVFHLPGLRAQPWWHPFDEGRDRSISVVVEALRKAYPAVLSEVSVLQKSLEAKESRPTLLKEQLESLPVESGEWTQLCLMDEGRWNEAVCSRLPVTTALLRRLPLCESTLGYAYLSRLAPSTNIAPHHGCTNVKLRAQLPLLVGPTDDEALRTGDLDGATNTDGAFVPFSGEGPAFVPFSGARRLVVGDDDNWHEYFAGEPLIFDDSYRHRVSNMTPHARVVLLVDLWHPNLTRRSISHLTRAFAPPPPQPPPPPPLPPPPIDGAADSAGDGKGGEDDADLAHRRSDDDVDGAPTATRGTEALPDEVLELALASLDVPELGRAAAACSRWAALVRGDGVWRQLYERECAANGVGVPVDGDDGTSEKGWCERYREDLHLRFDSPFPDPAALAAAAVAAGNAPPRVPPMKLLMVGDAGVGKSSFLLRFADDSFCDAFISTIGIDFKIKSVAMRGEPLKLMIWDTAGPERFRRITTAYYRGAHGVFVMFDVTDRPTFEHVRHWVQQVTTYGVPGTCVMIAGLKAGEEVDDTDPPPPDPRARRRTTGNQARPREVSAVEARQLAQELAEECGFAVPYFECSSRKGMRSVEQAIYTLSREVVRSERWPPEPQRPRPATVHNEPQVDRMGKCAIL